MDAIDIYLSLGFALAIALTMLVAFENKHLDKILLGTKKIIALSIGLMFIVSIGLGTLTSRVIDPNLADLAFLLGWVFLTPICMWFISFYNRKGSGQGPNQSERCKVIRQWSSIGRNSTIPLMRIQIQGKEATFTVAPSLNPRAGGFIDVYFQKGALGLNYVTEFKNIIP